MPARPALPAPRPLSPRAQVYVRQVHAAEAKRLHDVQNAVTKAVAAVAPVAKAKPKTDQVACYDADGNLIGVVDPDAITMIAPAKAPNSPDAPPTDLTPAPPGSVGTPADAVPAAKAMSLGAKGHQLGGKKPGPAAGVPVAPAEPLEDDEQVVAKARAGDFYGAGRIIKARLDNSHDAREQASAANTMQALAAAEFARMRRAGRAV